jgi:hypothetical protein
MESQIFVGGVPGVLEKSDDQAAAEVVAAVHGERDGPAVRVTKPEMTAGLALFDESLPPEKAREF